MPSRSRTAASFGSGESGPSLLAPLMLPRLSSRLGVPLLRGGERPAFAMDMDPDGDPDPMEDTLLNRPARRLALLRVGAGV